MIRRPPEMNDLGFNIMEVIRAIVADELSRLGFRGNTLDASHVSGVASSLLTHAMTAHIAGTLGQLPYAGASGVWVLLAGNTTATRKFLRQLGTGTVSAAPAWDTLLAADIPDLSATYVLLSLAKTVLSAGFDISSPGIKTITTAHGLASTPALEDVYLQVVEESNVDDWAYNLLKVESVDATNVVAKINVSTASVTGSQTAKLGILVLKV